MYPALNFIIQKFKVKNNRIYFYDVIIPIPIKSRYEKAVPGITYIAAGCSVSKFTGCDQSAIMQQRPDHSPGG
jgi:hypothetical protein